MLWRVDSGGCRPLRSLDAALGAVSALRGGPRDARKMGEADLRAGVPGARIVELPGAGLYMFLSNEADIMREVRAFGLTLKR